MAVRLGRDETDPSIFLEGVEWSERELMVQGNQRWIADCLDKYDLNSDHPDAMVVHLIRWCKWWAGRRRRRPVTPLPIEHPVD